MLIVLPLVIYAAGPAKFAIGTNDTINTTETGYQTVIPYMTIYEHGACKRVNHSMYTNHFVSTNTAAEWSNFRNNYPHSNNVVNCPFWKWGDWGACSTDCGAGYSRRSVTCFSRVEDTVDDSVCLHIDSIRLGLDEPDPNTKPRTQTPCFTTQACVYSPPTPPVIVTHESDDNHSNEDEPEEVCPGCCINGNKETKVKGEDDDEIIIIRTNIETGELVSIESEDADGNQNWSCGKNGSGCNVEEVKKIMEEANKPYVPPDDDDSSSGYNEGAYGAGNRGENESMEDCKGSGKC